jgi:hypothetical protein
VFRRTRGSDIANRWWDAELTQSEKVVYSARRTFKAERDEGAREILL